MKIHRFQLEGKLALAATALGLDIETLRAAVMPLLEVQEPRDHTLTISARDFRSLPMGRTARWRFTWNVPDLLRDQGFNPREAKIKAAGDTPFEVFILDKSQVLFDLQTAPTDMTLIIQW